MNDHPIISARDQFAWYKRALKGQFLDLPKGVVASGYYRGRGGHAVGIWRNGAEIVHMDDGLPQRVHSEAELAENVWSWINRSPISFALYEQVVAGGAWPEDVTTEVEAARERIAKEAPRTITEQSDEIPGIGHNSGALAHEMAADEIAAAAAAFTSWLASIGGKITTEEHDAKAEGFRERFLALGKKSDALRIAEKEPHLSAGRAVDKKWQPVIGRADTEKQAIGEKLRPYRIERERLRKEAEAKAAAERARVAAEHAQKARDAAFKNAPMPVAPPPAMAAPKPKTGLRTVKTLVVTDFAAVVGSIMALAKSPADFVETVETVARRLIGAGIPINGAEIREDKVV